MDKQLELIGVTHEITGKRIPLNIRMQHKIFLKTKLKLTTLKKVVLPAVSFSVIIYGTIVGHKTADYIKDLQSTNISLQKDIKQLEKYKDAYTKSEKKNMDLSEEIKDMKLVIKKTDKSILKLKKDNISINKKNKELIRKYNKLASRIKLYEKYKYAVIDESGKRTDLTYSQIKLGEQLMKEKGYNPHILFSIGMVESGFNESETSSKSTAKGYTQFLDGTAKFTWEHLLKHGKGSWHPSLALNGENNIRMCVAYFDYLIKKHDGNFYKAMGQYCGAGTKSGAFTYTYIKRMHKHAMRSGVSIYDIIDNM